MCRSAGTYAQLMAKEGEYVLLRLPSGELRKVHRNCLATIGQVGNPEHSNQKKLVKLDEADGLADVQRFVEQR
jgi:ribosomal protein L2